MPASRALRPNLLAFGLGLSALFTPYWLTLQILPLIWAFQMPKGPQEERLASGRWPLSIHKEGSVYGNVPTALANSLFETDGSGATLACWFSVKWRADALR
jgi:hypothetical protein